MSVVVEASSSRPRPLSAGLWTLFSWLRRDERSSSSESLSSVGSDRTTASFAFLSPALYRSSASPIPLPPPGAPTDSYKKRLQERNQRRKHERDLTLHRKYGLYRGEVVGYDVFTLPSTRNSLTVAAQERERRATSECLRRTAYVPGKRRAPQPPADSPTLRSLSVGPSSSFPRRHSRKRPAPQPPAPSVRNKENKHITYRDVSCNSDQMNSKIAHNSNLFPKDDLSRTGHKSDNYNKRVKDSKENRKMRSEKSFLKQIFENKKRNSCIEVSTTKLLPNISELDKQAAEIIESCKILEQNNNVRREKSMQIGYRDPESSQKNDSWICIRCLKKYDPAVKICLNCLSDSKKLSHNLPAEQKQSTSQVLNIYTQTEKENTNVALSVENKDVDEKLKLKKMLKEMKDSLPNRSKGKKIDDPKNKNDVLTVEPASKSTLDTPTLKIGCVARDDPGTSSHNIPVDSSRNIKQSPTTAERSTAFNGSEAKQINKLTNKPSVENSKETSAVSNSNSNHKTKINTAEINIAPLNISSLLNPIYIPKVNTEIVVQQNVSRSSTGADPIGKSGQSGLRASFLTQTSVIQQSDLTERSPAQRKLLNVAIVSNAKDVTPAKDTTKNPTSSTTKQGSSSVNEPNEINRSAPIASTSSQVPNKNNVLKQLDQHSRRRNLINQLEQSIAKGDEDSAAEAAAKLAQLRLSCSVLSFSSQIVGQANQPRQTSMQNIAQDKRVLSGSNKIHTRLEQPPKASSSTQSANIAPKETQRELKEKKMINEPVSANANKTQNEISRTAVPKNEVLPVKEDIKTLGQTNCNQATTSQAGVKENKDNLVPVEIWIEDKRAARGPIKLLVGREATVGDLRREAEVTLGLAARLQRWIVGRALCSDDATTLTSLAGAQLRTPFYLYLVESDTSSKNGPEAEKSGAVYSELVQLEQHPIVPNAEAFECEVCFIDCGPGEGVVLRDCVHTFCRQCLGDVVRHSEEPQVSCPALGCGGLLQEREVKALVPADEYERWLRRGLAAAESGTRDAFHCLTRDCAGWALCEPGVTRFPCPVCKCTNCLLCKAIHEGETCEQHRIKIQEALKAVDNNEQDEGTKTLIETLITRGEALECPECKAILTKKWGCDWVKCSACKTEICWVTRGRRWGPAGKGDTSAGCRCGVDGKRCHPSCAYCH